MERAFGILNLHFKILKASPEYPMEVQVNLVYALTTAVHNYVRMHAGEEALGAGLGEEEEEEDEPLEADELVTERSTTSTMGRKRGEIAEKMWTDYISYIG